MEQHTDKDNKAEVIEELFGVESHRAEAILSANHGNLMTSVFALIENSVAPIVHHYFVAPQANLLTQSTFIDAPLASADLGSVRQSLTISQEGEEGEEEENDAQREGEGEGEEEELFSTMTTALDASFALINLGTAPVVPDAPKCSCYFRQKQMPRSSAGSIVTSETEIKVSWKFQGVFPPINKAWLGLFHVNDPSHSNYVEYKYTHDILSGSMVFALPSKIGVYQFRLFAADKVLVAMSNPLIYGPHLSQIQAEVQQSNITVNCQLRRDDPLLHNIQSKRLAIRDLSERNTKRDWVGLFHISESNMQHDQIAARIANTVNTKTHSPVMYKYVQGFDEVDSIALSFATTFDLPKLPGYYCCRYFFADDRFGVFSLASEAIYIPVQQQQPITKQRWFSWPSNTSASATSQLQSSTASSTKETASTTPTRNTTSTASSEQETKYSIYSRVLGLLLASSATNDSDKSPVDIITPEIHNALIKIQRIENIPNDVHLRILQELGWPFSRFKHACGLGEYCSLLQYLMKTGCINDHEEEVLNSLKIEHLLSPKECEYCLTMLGYSSLDFDAARQMAKLQQEGGANANGSYNELLVLIARNLVDLRQGQRDINRNINEKHEETLKFIEARVKLMITAVKNMCEIDTPRLFLLFPAKKSWDQWLSAPTRWGKDNFTLRLICESHPRLRANYQPGSTEAEDPTLWHFPADHSGYFIEEPKLFIKQHATYIGLLSRMAMIVREHIDVIPIAGVVVDVGSAILTLVNVWEKEYEGPINEFYTSLVKVIEAVQQQPEAFSEQTPLDNAVSVIGADMREFSAFLKRLDPQRKYGGLMCVTDMTNGRVYWMCPDCAARYDALVVYDQLQN